MIHGFALISGKNERDSRRWLSLSIWCVAFNDENAKKLDSLKNNKWQKKTSFLEMVYAPIILAEIGLNFGIKAKTLELLESCNHW